MDSGQLYILLICKTQIAQDWVEFADKVTKFAWQVSIMLLQPIILQLQARQQNLPRCIAIKLKLVFIINLMPGNA